MEFQRLSPFWISLLVVWALMIFTFSIGEDAPGGESLDVLLSRVKYGLRVLVLLGLSVFCARRLTFPGVLFTTAVFTPLLLFVGWALLSCTWSARSGDSLPQVINLLVLCLLSIGFANLCRTTEDVERLVRHLCSALLAISVMLLVLRFGLPSMQVMQRSGSGLFHATNTAATASLGLVLLTAAWALWNPAWARQLLIPAVPVHLAVLWLSANRLSMAITIVLAGLLALRYANRFLLVLGIFVSCGLGTVYLALDPGFGLVSSVGESVGSYASRGQSAEELSAFSGREEMWDAIWTSFLQSPWIGHGYFVSSATGSIEVWYEDGNWTAHNTTLQVLVSTGVVGLCLLLAGLLIPVAFVLRRTLRNAESAGLPTLLLTLMTWFAAWGLMNESFMGPLQPESVVFFSVLGMAVGRAAALPPAAGAPISGEVCS